MLGLSPHCGGVGVGLELGLAFRWPWAFVCQSGGVGGGEKMLYLPAVT